MKITKQDVEYVARLARLELNEQEKERYTRQLESILEYIEQLNKLDTENVASTSHVLSLKNVWREDKVVKTSDEQREKILNNSPESENDFFKVKKVIT